MTQTETTFSVSKVIKLKFQLTKNKYEIKHGKLISVNDFLGLILDKYEKMEL